MLFNIVDPERFDDCLESVKNAFYPLKESDSDTKNEIAKARDENYAIDKVIAEGGGEPLSIPYLDSYYEFFLQRKPDPKSMFSITDSKNEGNYYHFVNVVAALARLIIYFQDPKNVDYVFAANSDGRLKLHEHDRGLLVYDKIPSMRTFRLMLAGFYHDLGKTITDPRHPMEGAIILAHHTTQNRHKLDKIAKRYNKLFEFERDDLLFIADLVLFHDQYGTLSTGEDGYMALVYAIDRIKRYSLKPDPEKEDTGTDCFERCKKHIFDLWLLNVADIMVSIKKKFEPQEPWGKEDTANDEIEAFFKGEKGVRLRHDFEITFALLKKHTKNGKSAHCDDLSTLESESYNWSKRHSIERLRRLVTELLTADMPIGEILKKINKFPEEPGNSDKKKVLELIKMIIDDLQKLPESHWNSLLTRSIQSVADFDDFTTRLSWIGKMDYALSFFQKILRQALYQVICELIMQEGGDNQIAGMLFGNAPKEPAKRTGWIRDPGYGDLKDEGATLEFYSKTQAVFFADNFVATMIQILEHLLFRERAIDRLRNIEFSDTKNRLTEDKLNQVLSLEGPYRARRSIQSILQTIYLY